MDLSAITGTVDMADTEATEVTEEDTDQWVEPNKYQMKNILSNWERSMIQTESFSGNKYSKG
jgi:hypothetical protein